MREQLRQAGPPVRGNDRSESRLDPYEKFAEMIERHSDGITAFCKR